MRTVVASWLAGALVVLSLRAAPARAADWPMTGFDARHSASTSEELPADMQLQWSMKLPALKEAWPDQVRLKDDGVYRPIVAGGLLIVGSSRDDSVTAYRLSDGTEAWRFFTQGPIRVAPAAAD